MLTFDQNLGKSSRKFFCIADLTPFQGQIKQQVDLNILTGNLFLASPDFFLPSIGLPIKFNRYYNSQDKKWRIGPTRRLIFDPNDDKKIIRKKDDGHQQTFIFNAELQKYSCIDGDNPTVWLSKEANGWLYQELENRYQEKYHANGGILSSQDLDQNFLNYRYADGKLKAIYTKSGDIVFLDYYDNGLLKALRFQDEVVAEYFYSTNKRLERVKLGHNPGYSLYYDYYTDGKIHSCWQEDGTKSIFSYDSNSFIKTITDGEGRISKFLFKENQAILTHPDQSQSFYYSGQAKTAEKQLFVKAQEGEHNLIFVYRVIDGKIEKIIRNKTAEIFQYNLNGQVSIKILVRDGIVHHKERYEYNAIGQITLTEFLDDKDVVLKKEQKIYDDKFRLHFEIDALGGVTEYQYNDLGQVTLKRKYADIERKNYAEIIFEYDNHGNIRQENVLIFGDLRKIINKDHNIFGKIIRKNINNNPSEIFASDFIGRTIMAVNQLGYATTIEYKDSDSQLIETKENNLKITVQNNHCGKTGNIIKAAERATFLYDLNGRIFRTMVNHKYSYTLYDNTGNLLAKIDHTGLLTEYKYDENGREIASTVYPVLVDLEILKNRREFKSSETLELIRPKSYDADKARITQKNYDQATGWLKSVIAPNKSVTEYKYDLFGNIIHEIKYAGTEPDLLKDRHTRKFYNLKGELIAKLNSEGLLKVYELDLLGRRIKKTRYSFTNPDINIWDDSVLLEQIIPKKDDDKREDLYSYNYLNQKTSHTDALGYVTEFKYDNAGNLIEKTRDNDFQIIYEYDVANQLISEKHSNGLIKIFERDELGRVVSSCEYDKDDKAHTRELTHKYNLQGNIISESTGEGRDTLYVYNDSLNLKAKKIDPNGNATRYFYDDKHQLKFIVNSLGEITEYSYNAFGEEESVRRYAKRLDFDLSILDGSCLLEEIIFEEETRIPANPKFQTYGQWFRTMFPWLATRHRLADLIAILKSDKDDTLIETLRNNSGLISAKKIFSGEYSENIEESHEYNAFGEKCKTSKGNLSEEIFEYDRLGKTTKNTIKFSEKKRESETSYDIFGNIKSRIDSDGAVTEYQHDKLDRQIKITNDSKQSVTTVYDSQSRIKESCVDPDGLNLITKFSCEDKLRKTTITSPEGNISEQYKNVFGEIVQEVDPLKRITQKKYNANGQLEKHILPSGRAAEFTYDKRKLLEKSVDFDGVVTTHEYDEEQRKIASYFSDQELKDSIWFSTLGFVSEIIDPNGRKTKYSRNARGDIIIEACDPEGLNCTTRYHYAGHVDIKGVGAPVWISKGTGEQFVLHKKISRNGLGEAIEIELAPLRDFDGNDLPKDKALEQKIANSYNQKGRVVEEVDEEGGVKQKIYNKLDQLKFEIDQLGQTTEHHYDAAGREISIITGETKKIEFVYNKDGQKILINDNGCITKQIFNKAGELEKKICFAEKSIDNTDKISEQDQVSHYLYDKDGRLIYEINVVEHPHTSAITEYRYDDKGLTKHKIKYAKFIPYKESYGYDDIANLAVSEEDRWTTEIFDDARRKIYSVDQSGFITRYFWDKNHSGKQKEVKRIEYAEPIADHIPRTRENIIKAKEEIIAADLVVETEYDALGRISSVKSTTYGQDYLEKYEYDELSNRIKKTVNNKYITEYKYDLAGREIAIIHPETNIASIEHDKDDKALKSAVTKGRIVEKKSYYKTGALKTTSKGVYNTSNPFVFDEHNKTSFAYDKAQKLKSTTIQAVVDNDGNPLALPSNLSDLSYGDSSDISDEIIRDAFSRQIITKISNNTNFVFKVFDINDNVIFEFKNDGYVTERKYNALGLLIEEIKYASPIKDFSAQDLSQKPELLSEDLFRSHILPNIEKSDDDRSTKFIYDARGVKKLKQQASILTYRSDSSEIIEVSPTVLYITNAFGEVVKQEEAIDPAANKHRISLFWTDKSGNIKRSLVETTVDKNGDRYGKLVDKIFYRHNKEQEVVEYYSEVKFPTSPNYNLVIVLHKKDRKIQQDFDGFGKIREQRKFGVNYQVIKEATATTLENQIATEKYSYDDFLELCAIENSKGERKLLERDAMKRVILVIDFPRLVNDEMVNPATSITYAANGAKAIETVYAHGEVDIDKNRPRTNLYLTDSRKKVLCEQKSNGHLVFHSYNALGLVFKTWEWVQQSGLTEDSAATHPCQLYWQFRYNFVQYDSNFEHSRLGVLQDDGNFKITDFTRSAFNQHLATAVLEYSPHNKSFSDKTLREQHKYNRSGFITATNAKDGVWRVYLTNALGHNLLTISTMDNDLNLAELAADPRQLLKSPERLLLHEALVDSTGFAHTNYLPGYYEKIDLLNIKYSLNNPAFGINSISWEETDDHFEAYDVFIQTKGFIGPAQPQKAKKINNRFGIDLSAYDEGDYEFFVYAYRAYKPFNGADSKYIEQRVVKDKPSIARGEFTFHKLVDETRTPGINATIEGENVVIDGDLSNVVALILTGEDGSKTKINHPNIIDSRKIIYPLNNLPSQKYFVSVVRERMHIIYGQGPRAMLANSHGPSHAARLDYRYKLGNVESSGHKILQTISREEIHGFKSDLKENKSDEPYLEKNYYIDLKFSDVNGRSIDLSLYGDIHKLPDDYVRFHVVTPSIMSYVWICLPSLEGYSDIKKNTPLDKVHESLTLELPINHITLTPQSSTSFNFRMANTSVQLANISQVYGYESYSHFWPWDDPSKYAFKGKNKVRFSWNAPAFLGAEDFDIFARYNVYSLEGDKGKRIPGWKPADAKDLTLGSHVAVKSDLRTCDMELYYDHGEVEGERNLYGYYGQQNYTHPNIGKDEWLHAVTISKKIAGKTIYLFSGKPGDNDPKLLTLGPFPENLGDHDTVEFFYKESAGGEERQLISNGPAVDPKQAKSSITIPTIQTAGKFLVLNHADFKNTKTFDYRLRVKNSHGKYIDLSHIGTIVGGFLHGSFIANASSFEQLATSIPIEPAYIRPLTTQTQDIHGNLIKYTDEEGYTTEQEFGAHGNLEQVIEPEVDAPDPSDVSKTIKIRPKTQYLHNIAGEPLGRIDANGGVWLETSQQGTVLESRDPTGVITKQLQNIFGEVIASISTEGAVTELIRDDGGFVIAVVLPEINGKKPRKTYVVNGLGHRISKTSATGAKYWAGFGMSQNAEQILFVKPDFNNPHQVIVSAKKYDLVSGKQSLEHIYKAKKVVDHATVTEVESEKSVKSESKYHPFGQMKWHRDFGGNEVKYLFNALMLVTQEQAVNHSLVPLRNIVRKYAQNAVLTEIINKTEGTRQLIEFDKRGLTISEAYIHQDGHYYRLSAAVFDGMRRQTFLLDLSVHVETVFDAVSNRMVVNFLIAPRSIFSSPELLFRDVYTYDLANRILSKIGRYVSNLYGYEKGRKNYEKNTDHAGKQTVRNLSHDLRSRLASIQQLSAGKEVNSVFVWDDDDRQIEYTERTKGEETPNNHSLKTYDNLSGMQITEHRENDLHKKDELETTQEITTKALSILGAVTEIEVKQLGKKGQYGDTTSKTRTDYLRSDIEQPERIRTEQVGHPEKNGTTQITYDSLPAPASKTDTLDPGGDAKYINDLQGNRLHEVFYITGKKGTKDEDKKIPVIGHYFYQGNIRAIQYFTFENGEVLTSDNWSDPDFWPRADLNHFPLTENNITGAGPYIIQAEDTWELIALRLYGDPSYSQLIAAANGRELHERLIAGEELATVVRPVTLHNNIKTRQVLGLINTQNNFYPTTARFEPPEDLRNYFAQYLAIAAETAVAYALAPATGGGSLLLSELILESVIAGVASNLTGQVINAVAGNQDGIDGKSLLYSGATSALTAGVNFYAANPLGRAAANSGINMAAQFARGREFSEQDLFFTGASNAISLGVNSFVDSSITRGLVTDALDNGLQMAIYSTKSVDWGVMLAHAGGAYLGNKMHDGIAQQHAARYSELHSYNVNTDAFLNSYTGSDLTIGGLMSRLDAERPLSLGFGGVREAVVAANDSGFGAAVTRMYNNQLNSPGIMGSVARFDRGFGSALREGMVSVASSLLHPLDTLSSSLLFATDIADIPLELLGVMFSSDAKTRNLQRLDGIRDVGVGLISGDATQSGHAAGQLSSLVFSAYGVKMGGALSVDVLSKIRKFDASLRLIELDPSIIRTTQTTVKQQGATLPGLEQSMREKGFLVEHDRIIDVVRMPDGGLTSLDNTRILAAQRAGVKIKARVHEYRDPLPEDKLFRLRFENRRDGSLPSTFGEAVKNRIDKQNSGYRNVYPEGSFFIGTRY